ncbi:hypothetical protein ACVDG3_08740 [Meridianimarinicoccus sp. RP-17]|uniref:hypothetical protein n=1 Tax=Meridianimarinicoccus zhengii TaxID=2056810 RepID=UPI0013A6E752|nr:hypothetical protein [Phycocomes zhengii]
MTRHITTFGRDLMRAISGTPLAGHLRLRGIVADAVHGANGSLDRALDKVERAVRDEPRLLVELLDERKFLRALCRSFTESEARRHGVTLRKSDAMKPGTQDRPAATTGAATTTSTGRAKHSMSPTHSLPRRSGAMMAGAAGAARVALLDVMRVNGQPLRAVTAGEALKYADKTKSDAVTIERICAGLKERVPVGDQIDDAEAARRAAPS